MNPQRLRRLLAPIVEVRDEESVTALLMFAYSFLAMTSYNIIQPLTRSKLIRDLGAVNIPYVVFASGLIIGVLMLGYTRLHSALPRRWALPITQAVMAAMMLTFWALFQTEQEWVSVAFYLWGALLGVLLISQFWTLANGIYDPRQAKRLFGFVGGGVALGGMTGSGLTALIIESVGANTLLLWSALALVLCPLFVAVILGREGNRSPADAGATGTEKGVTVKRAIHLLRDSRQVQLIAVVIGFGSLGAALIDQQVNMAAETMGQGDDIGKFLAQIRFGLSAAAFVIQVWITPRIHRYLGIGFALLMLPTNLGLTAAAIALTAHVWAPAVATIMDRSLRYTVDKTTREVLFLPLPIELRQEVKPFVDVTVDRVSKGIGAVFILILIQPWGLNITWYQLSWVSGGLTLVWWFMAIRAKREYLLSFRQSIAQQEIEPAEVRVNMADFSTVETLVEELASPDERRVVYAIELLESLDKRNLITPLLLHHESPRVRARALAAMQAARPDLGERWLPAIEQRLTDPDYDVRTAAVRTLATLRRERAAELMRPYLDDRDPRLVVTAAIALADSPVEADVLATERALRTIVDDARESAAEARRDVARAIPAIRNPHLRHLLIPLFYDADVTVAMEAVRGAGKIASADVLFVPPLLALMRHRLLKAAARQVLVGYGESIIGVLGHVLGDQDEDVWVRRHIPGTLALIPSQLSMNLLVEVLSDPDGFLRYQAVAAIERLSRERPDLSFDRTRLEALAVREAMRYFNYLSLLDNLRRGDPESGEMLLASALEDKLDRTKDRIYRVLSLLHPWRDIAAARWAFGRGDARARASAAEYLDNLLTGDLRKRVLPVLEDLPHDERVRKANVFIQSRPRDVQETVMQLVYDEDPVVSSAAIHYIEARKLDALAGDLEHTLAHRDARDWSVFEAASWALASQRMTDEERRRRWMEPLPAVEVANGLRRVPLFEFVSVDELFRVAATGDQIRYEPGHRIDEPGARTGTLRFLLQGRVRHAGADGTGTFIDAPAALGFEAVLAGAPIADTMTAVDRTTALSLSSDDFLTLLSNNTQLAKGLFRMRTAGGGSTKPSLVVMRSAVLPPRSAGDTRRTSAVGLLPIEKVLVLQAVPMFARATADDLLALSAIAREVPIVAGSNLFKEGEPAAIYTVLTGRLQLLGERLTPILAGPGDTIGVVETLGSGLSETRAHALEAGSALRLDREALFERLCDRLDLLRSLYTELERGL